MKTIFSASLIMCCTFFLLLSEASAEFGDELRWFRSDGNPQPGDEFGYSVGIDGTNAIFGAPGADPNGDESGAAYLFDITTGQQLRQLLPNDAQPEDRFGVSVAVEGNIAIVGSLLADTTGRSSGAAYLFDINTGQQLHKLIGDNTVAGDEFGVSVDIEDGTAIVGAHMHGEGRAYLFDVASGQQTGMLISADAEPEDLFGVAVALDGTTALVGARYDDDLGIASGAAYLFDITTGQQRHKLTAHDGAWGDRFGMYVDVDGNTAIVASRYDDDQIKSSGSAYLFNVDDGQERYKLVAEDSDPNDHFGSSVSVSGNLALVGAANDEPSGNLSGSAYLFDLNSGKQLAKITASDGGILDQFGTAVAMEGDLAVIGAMQVDFVGNVDPLPSGKGYVFDTTQVPEPNGLPMALLAMVTLLRLRKRRD